MFKIFKALWESILLEQLPLSKLQFLSFCYLTQLWEKKNAFESKTGNCHWENGLLLSLKHRHRMNIPPPLTKNTDQSLLDTRGTGETTDAVVSVKMCDFHKWIYFFLFVLKKCRRVLLAHFSTFNRNMGTLNVALLTPRHDDVRRVSFGVSVRSPGDCGELEHVGLL